MQQTQMCFCRSARVHRKTCPFYHPRPKVKATPRFCEPRDCSGCRDKSGPSHDGSVRCKSGSIASGGKNAHCSCDTCY